MKFSTTPARDLSNPPYPICRTFYRLKYLRNPRTPTTRTAPTWSVSLCRNANERNVVNGRCQSHESCSMATTINIDAMPTDDPATKRTVSRDDLDRDRHPTHLLARPGSARLCPALLPPNPPHLLLLHLPLPPNLNHRQLHPRKPRRCRSTIFCAIRDANVDRATSPSSFAALLDPGNLIWRN